MQFGRYKAPNCKKYEILQKFEKSQIITKSMQKYYMHIQIIFLVDNQRLICYSNGDCFIKTMNSKEYRNMNITFDTNLVYNYTSNSQKARILTESWVSQNSYCPICGHSKIVKLENNKPVADFYCEKCKEVFELKSKKGNFSKTINDGAYNTMIERITSNTNPYFLFLNYDGDNYNVRSFILIPKYYFTPDIIIKRKPLSSNARRAGWIGCNIDMNKIPASGKIFIIKDGVEMPKKTVLFLVNQNRFLSNENIQNRGWILDVMKCIERLNKRKFELSELYRFEIDLKMIHPHNNNIKAKIRQQLQKLRDNGYLIFEGRGKYCINNGNEEELCQNTK